MHNLSWLDRLLIKIALCKAAARGELCRCPATASLLVRDFRSLNEPDCASRSDDPEGLQ